MVQHVRLKEAVELVQLADNVKRLLVHRMERWKTILTGNTQGFGEVNIKRGIFHRDTLPPYRILLIPLSSTLELECG